MDVGTSAAPNGCALHAFAGKMTCVCHNPRHRDAALLKENSSTIPASAAMRKRGPFLWELPPESCSNCHVHTVQPRRC
jgi:hypothetical protein